MDSQQDKNRLHIFERWIVKKISGPLQTGENTWVIQSYIKLDHLTNGAGTVIFIKEQRIRWSDHIQRMDSSRMAKIILK
jgi:hypothetical protein